MGWESWCISMAFGEEKYTFRPLTLSDRWIWERFVMEHGHLLQSWTWGDLKASATWRPLRLGLFDERQQLVAGAQVLRRTAPRVPVQLGHLAYIPKGPVLDWTRADVRDLFFARLHPFLRRHGALALRFECDLEAETPLGEQARAYFESEGMQSLPSVQPLRTIQLDIEPSEEALLSQMKEKWRYNVRLARKRGVTIRLAETLEDIQSWYTLMETTSERDKFGIHSLRYYQRAWQMYHADDRLRLYLAEHEGQLLAGIFVSLYAQEGIYMYGASSNEKRQLMPNYLLQWEAIRWVKSCGAVSYDFWGIPDTEAEDEAMAGVYRFKRGWGGRVVHFVGGYQYVYHPLAMKLASRFV